MAEPKKIALVHDWVMGMRGGEKVLDAICEIYPNSTLFTLLYFKNGLSPRLARLNRKVSILQKVPGIQKRYRYFLPIFPNLIERFDLSEYDLVISSSHCVAKGVRKRPDAVHVSYVHAPMRYVWDRFDDYFDKDRSPFVTRTAAKAFRSRLKRWDQESASVDRIDAIMANSHYIADEIKNNWKRDAEVVFPFVDLERFQVLDHKRNHYLVLSALVPYKKIDLAVKAFSELGLPLTVVGTGPELPSLQKAAGPSVTFLGHLSDASVKDVLSRSKALVFPGKEDFGITPLEAMACGVPVIAYGQGGVLDTVTRDTGLFCEEQTVESLKKAIKEFEGSPGKFSASVCRARAEEFSREKFINQFRSVVDRAVSRRPQDASPNKSRHDVGFIGTGVGDGPRVD